MPQQERGEGLIKSHHILLQNKSTRIKEKVHRTDTPKFCFQNKTEKNSHFSSKKVASLQNYVATCPDCYCFQLIRQSSHKD